MVQCASWSEARSLGLKRYFTGKPCKHGHVAERHAVNGFCVECGRLKQAAWRANNPEEAQFRYREWKQRRPEVAKAATKRWRANNPDKVRQHAKRKYEKNKDSILAAQRSYNARNSKRIVARVLAWAKANPERVRVIKNNWIARNPEKVRLNGARQAARRRNAVGTFDQDDINRIFAAQRGRCAYCGISLKRSYDIDHIQPLARGGNNTPANLQLCCRKCNAQKRARDPLAFARSLGRLL